MPKSTQRLLAAIIAVVIIVATSFAIWLPLSFHAKYEKEAKERRSIYYEDTSEIVVYCSGLPVERQIECLGERINGAAESYRAESDLAAQRKMAVWTAAIGVVAIIGVPLSLAGLLALIWTLLKAQRANEIAASGRRAWIGIESIEVDPNTKVTSTGAGLKVSVTVKNYGETPATNMWVRLGIIFKAGPHNTSTVREKAMERAHIGAGVVSVFPGKEHRFPDTTIQMLRRQLDEELDDRPPEIGVMAYLTVTVGYRIGGDPTGKYTGTARVIMSPDLRRTPTGTYPAQITNDMNSVPDWIT